MADMEDPFKGLTGDALTRAVLDAVLKLSSLPDDVRKINKKIDKLGARVGDLENSKIRMRDDLESVRSTQSARSVFYSSDGPQRPSLVSGPPGAGVGEDRRAFRDEYPYRR